MEEEVQAGANFGIKIKAGDGFLRDLETGDIIQAWVCLMDGEL